MSDGHDHERARYARALAKLVESIERDGISDRAVLDAIGKVPRHLFIPPALRAHAYADDPLPIGLDQTISQPFVVAWMTALAHLDPHATPRPRVLEVGTGSGYQTAVLAALGVDVYTIEIREELAKRALAVLARLGYGERVQSRVGDGYRGWIEQAPFDAILVTAAPPRIPEPLIAQLRIGASMVVPVGIDNQELIVLTRTEEGVREMRSGAVRFVPMIGEVIDDPRTRE